MYNEVYLALGSNLGDKSRNIYRAVEIIKERLGEVVALSSLYETIPEGFESKNMFVNAACIVLTLLSPMDVLKVTQEIEREMGRQVKSNGNQYSDRVIDIDLLMYNEDIVRTQTLTVPHPRLQERHFVLDPLAEIAGDKIHPVFKKTIRELKELLDRDML